MKSGTHRWSVLPDTVLHWYCADDETLVYYEQAGTTHLLTATSAEALRFLEYNEANIGELVAVVSQTLTLDVDGDDEFFFLMEALVEQLQKLGLIEACAH